MKRFFASAPSYTKDSDRPARWKISSNWRSLTTVRRYLICKWVFSELTQEEYRFLLDTLNPKFDMFMIVVKLFHKLKNKKEIQRILNTYYSTDGKEVYNHRTFKLLDAEARKSLKLEIYYTRRRKGIKYSGWARSVKDQGSLGTNVEKDFHHLIPEEGENLEEKFIQKLLSVSESQHVFEYLGPTITKKYETELLSFSQFIQLRNFYAKFKSNDSNVV